MSNRTPYVGAGPEGCRRSAEIDRTEADGLPTGPHQLGWTAAAQERRQRLLESAEAWERQAQQELQAMLPVVPARDGGDGYDWMDRLHVFGWQPISSWGQDGWDAGRWPLVIFAKHSDPARSVFGLVYYVEGDIEVKAYDNEADRNAELDRLIFWHWKAQSESWVKDIDRVEDLPARMRGPFSWARLEAANKPADT